MFGRKYNAERHNENIHDGLATIYDKRQRSSTVEASSSSSEPNFNSKNPFHKTSLYK